MFCVVWNKIEKSLIKTDILEKMRRGSRYFVERKNCQSLWLITLENSTTDFCFSDRFSVYFNGCVYNKEELQKLLPNSKDCSIAHIINQLYQIYGTFLFEKINGLFVVIIIDTLKRNVLIARDRFGWKSIILEDWSVNEVAYALAKAFKQVAKNATVLCNIATPERI